MLRIGGELLAGLRVVHEHGLVHCDVKPANVMLGPGPAKLIDFGIATQPHEGTDGDTSIGSLRFMSPEQLHGEALTPASDLFSLGAVLYQSLTGRPPYPGETPEEISAAHAAGRVRPPSTLVDGIPGRLDEAILQALRRDPSERFDSADAMAASLEASAGEIAQRRDDDTTQMVRVPPPPPPAPSSAPSAGYVPPVAPPQPHRGHGRPGPASRAAGPRAAPRRERVGRDRHAAGARRGGAGGRARRAAAARARPRGRRDHTDRSADRGARPEHGERAGPRRHGHRRRSRSRAGVRA